MLEKLVQAMHMPNFQAIPCFLIPKLSKKLIKQHTYIHTYIIIHTYIHVLPFSTKKRFCWKSCHAQGLKDRGKCLHEKMQHKQGYKTAISDFQNIWILTTKFENSLFEIITFKSNSFKLKRLECMLYNYQSSTRTPNFRLIA